MNQSHSDGSVHAANGHALRHAVTVGRAVQCDLRVPCSCCAAGRHDLPFARRAVEHRRLAGLSQPVESARSLCNGMELVSSSRLLGCRHCLPPPLPSPSSPLSHTPTHPIPPELNQLQLAAPLRYIAPLCYIAPPPSSSLRFPERTQTPQVTAQPAQRPLAV